MIRLTGFIQCVQLSIEFMSFRFTAFWKQDEITEDTKKPFLQRPSYILSAFTC